MDYKNIIKQLNSCVFTVMTPELAGEAATAIKLLIEERDAAIRDLSRYNDCKTCNQNCGGCDYELEVGSVCDYWKWRGIQYV